MAGWADAGQSVPASNTGKKFEFTSVGQVYL